MKRLEFDSDCELVDKIETLLENVEDHPLISVYGKFDIIKTLLEDLIAEGFSIAGEIQLEDYEISHYDREFILYVKPDEVSVEKIFVDDRYLYGSGDISFVHEDCSSTLLKYIESVEVFEFGYKDEDCDCKCCCEKADDKLVTTAKSEYRVNGKITTKEEYDKALSDIEDKYMDNIRDMLLRYSSFMDDFNQFLRSFY